MNKFRIIVYILLLSFFSCFTSIKTTQPFHTIPFKLIDDIVIIKVSVNGSAQLNFIFDTGTTTTLIDSISAQNIGLISDESQGLVLNNDIVEMPMAKIKSLKAGNLILENRPIIITQSFENYDRILGIPIHGIIGMDFFGKYTTELNFDKQCINLGSNIDTSGYSSIGVKVQNELFYVNASIFTSPTDSVSNSFLFDSADLTAASLAQPFWTKYNLLDKSKSYYSGINRSSSSITSASYFARFDGFKIDKYHFNTIYLNLTSSKRGFFSNDSIAGTIGIDILKRFNIIINPSKQKIYLKPNKKINDPYRINTTGLRARLTRDMTQCIIEAVLQHSPADSAGLQSGDILVSINKIVANKENIAKIRQLTRSIPGTKLLFLVKRNNEFVKKTVVCNFFSDK